MARCSGFSLLLLLALSSTSHALDLATFLTDPTYALLAAKAVSAPSCLTDPAVSSGAFDLDRCPSLKVALQELNAGGQDVTAECEPECAETFYNLSAACLGELANAFATDSSPIGLTGQEFLAACSQERENGGAAGPSPAMAPDMAAVDEAPSPVA